jgi:hypothetical protein
MHPPNKILSLIVGLGALTSPLQALDSIGWSYDRASITPDSLSSAEVAGVAPYAQSHWNNHTSLTSQGPGTIPFALVNNSGTATTASVTAWTLVGTHNGWTENGSYAGADLNGKLMNSYTANQPSLTFSNIPSDYQTTGYKVVVYFKNGTNQVVSVTGSVNDFKSRTITSATNVYTTVGFVEKTDTSTATNTNYTVFTGLDDPNFTLSSGLGIYAIQIVKDEGPPPLPSNPWPVDDPFADYPISVAASMSWNPSKRAEGYELYLWKASESEPVTPTATLSSSTTTYTPPGGFQISTEYHWKVVALSGTYGNTTGDTWTFFSGDGGLPGASSLPFPDTGTTKVSVETILLWEQAANALSYEVYLWPSSGTKPETPTATVTGTSYTPAAQLAGLTSYSWQVVSVNEVGKTDGPVWTFTTSDFYNAGRDSIGWNFASPYGSFAATSKIETRGAGAPGYGQYNWNDHAPTGSSNQGTSGAPIPLTLKNSAGTTTTAQVTAFSVTTGNSWGNVAANTASGNSRLMATYIGNDPSVTFSTLPASYQSDGYTVVVYYSSSGSANRTITLTGSANDARTRAVRTGANATPSLSAQYDVVGFIEGTDANSTTATNYTVFTGLDDPGFTVKINSVGLTGIQIVREVGAPSAPITPVPAVAATDVATSATLSWAAAKRATTYDVYLWKTSESEPGTPTASGLTSTSYQPSPVLDPATAYSWRVVATNDSGSTTSATWTFTTGENLPPVQAANPTPAAGATTVALGTSFNWDLAARASSYQLFLWKTSESAPGTPTATSLLPGYTPPAPLDAATSYSWRVDTVNGVGTTTGTVWTFTTGFPPDAVTVPFPADGATVPLTYDHLDWADSATATSYRVFLWPSSETAPTTPTEIVTTSRSLQTVLPTASTSYSWRVDPVNAFGTTTGTTWSFTTSTVVTETNSIGWKHEYATPVMAETAVAGIPGFRQAYWNRQPNGQSAGLLQSDFKDSSGNTTAMGLTAWTQSNADGSPNGNGYRYYQGGPTASPYTGKVPYSDALLTNSFSIPRPKLTFSNIPYANYTVIVHYGKNDAGAATSVQLLDGDTQIASRAINTGGPAPGGSGQSGPFLITPYDAGYVEATDETPSTTETNYTVFTGLTLSQLTVHIPSGDAGISAVQFIETTSGGGDPYGDWATTAGLVGGDAAFDADPDGDGIDNGLEFLLGGQPKPGQPDSNSLSLLPIVEVDEDFLIFTFDRAHAAEDIVAIVEFSTTLDGEWTEATELNATIETEPGTTTDRVKVSIPKGEANALFARLRAVDPTPAP